MFIENGTNPPLVYLQCLPSSPGIGTGIPSCKVVHTKRTSFRVHSAPLWFAATFLCHRSVHIYRTNVNIKNESACVVKYGLPRKPVKMAAATCTEKAMNSDWFIECLVLCDMDRTPPPVVDQATADLLDAARNLGTCQWGKTSWQAKRGETRHSFQCVLSQCERSLRTN